MQRTRQAVGMGDTSSGEGAGGLGWGLGAVSPAVLWALMSPPVTQVVIGASTGGGGGLLGGAAEFQGLGLG